MNGIIKYQCRKLVREPAVLLFISNSDNKPSKRVGGRRQGIRANILNVVTSLKLDLLRFSTLIVLRLYYPSGLAKGKY